MIAPRVHTEREWLVGGYEVPHDQEDQWRAWRDIKIARKLVKEIRAALDECLAICHELVGQDSGDGYDAKLLMHEAAVNMYGHGKRGSPINPSQISFRAEVLHPEEPFFRFVLSMHDDQPQFDINGLPDPRYDENLEEVTGRGILLIRSRCRARIAQVPHEVQGKYMVYEWQSPKYSLAEVGLAEEEAPEVATASSDAVE